MARLLCYPRDARHFLHKQMIEQRDNTADTENGNNGSKTDANEMMRENQTDTAGQTDVKQIKAVFCEADGFSDKIRNCLHDAVSWVRDDAHVERHGGADAGTDDTARQNKKLIAKALRRRNPSGKQIHKSGEYQTQRQLQQIHDEKQVEIAANDRRAVWMDAVPMMECQMNQQFYEDKDGV